MSDRAAELGGGEGFDGSATAVFVVLPPFSEFPSNQELEELIAEHEIGSYLIVSDESTDCSIALSALPGHCVELLPSRRLSTERKIEPHILVRLRAKEPTLLILVSSNFGLANRYIGFRIADDIDARIVLFRGGDRSWRCFEDFQVRMFLWTYGPYIVARKTIEILRAIVSRKSMSAGVKAGYSPISYFDPLTGRILHRKRQNKGGLQVSPLGYVETVPALNLKSLEPSSRPRIILLGGSALYGVGLTANEDTIGSRLRERLIAGWGEDVEVLNYGITGVASRSEAALLIFKLIYASPDMVVVISGFNDFITHFSVPERHGAESEILNWSFFDYFHYLAIQAPEEITNRNVPFVEKKMVREKYPYLDRDLFPESGARLRRELWGENVGAMAAVCEARGIGFLAFLQPYEKVATGAKNEWWLAANSDAPFAPDESETERWHRCMTALKETYDIYRRQMEDLSNRYTASRFVDLSGLFDDSSESSFVDGVHLNALGAACVANEIADVLIDQGKPSRE